MDKSDIRFEVSSGNVFADLGLPDAEDLLAKAALVHRISEIIEERAMTQAQIAKVLGTTQPKVSDLMIGRLKGFSMERLIRYLNALDEDVEIVTSPKPRSRNKAITRVVVPSG